MELAAVLFLVLTITMLLISPLGWISPSVILSSAWAFVYVLQSVFAPDMESSLVATMTILVITMCFAVGEMIGCTVLNGGKGEGPVRGGANSSGGGGVTNASLRLQRAVIVSGLLSIAGAIEYANALQLFDADSMAEFLLLPGEARVKIFTGEISVSLISRVGFLLSYSSVVLALTYYYLYGWRWWLLLPVLAVVLLGMSQSGRTGIFIVLVQFMLCIYLKNLIVFKRHPVRFTCIGGMYLSFLAFCFFVSGQFLREGFGATEFDDVIRVASQLRAYLFGGVSAYSTWIGDEFEWEMPTWGRYSFSALFDLLGLFPQAPGVYDSYSRIASSGETANIFTAYRSFIEDFSIVGACIIYMSVGGITGHIAVKVIQGKSEFLAILVPALSFLTFSPMLSLTYYNSFILSCFAPYLLMRIYVGDVRSDPDARRQSI